MADPAAAEGRNLLDLVRLSVKAGATSVQLRAKEINTREFLDLALGLAAILRPRRIPLIINDRADIALACRSAGVHLGQSDLPLPTARRILGRSCLIGASARSVGEAVIAQAQGADYLGVGPLFQTASKPMEVEPLGTDGLRAIRAAVRLPILAIGGIHSGNAADVIRAGADGVAVISTILGAEDPGRATRELLQAVRTGLSRSRRPLKRGW